MQGFQKDLAQVRLLRFVSKSFGVFLGLVVWGLV